jgi:hypothetical protein
MEPISEEIIIAEDHEDQDYVEEVGDPIMTFNDLLGDDASGDEAHDEEKESSADEEDILDSD